MGGPGQKVRNNRIAMEQAFIATPLGVAELNGDSDGLRSVRILDGGARPSDILPESLEDACYQLKEYFVGARHIFDLKLNPDGTAFQQKVWRAISEIPYGKSCSYLQLSKTVGDPNAIRAVATSCGKNPLWVLIPCHRIIGSDGSLVGYGGGLHRKKWLLEHESPNKQVKLF